mgnify:FL=1|tara:strand:- start:893 stop:1366 length:474 start_codon:yes stop_codon:yes gene_type:complete
MEEYEICGVCCGPTVYMNGEEGYPSEEEDEIRRCEWCGHEFTTVHGNGRGEYYVMTTDYGDVFKAGDLVALDIKDEKTLASMGCEQTWYASQWPLQFPVWRSNVPDDLELIGLITKVVGIDDGWCGYYYFVQFTNGTKYRITTEPLAVSGWKLKHAY